MIPARLKELLPALVVVAVVAALAAVIVLGSRVVTQHPSAGSPSTSPTSAPTATGTVDAPGTPSTAPPPQSLPSSVPSLDLCRTPRHLRVMTFNIHSARSRHGDGVTKVAAEITAAHPDVVLLQEVDQGLRRTGDVDMPKVLGEATGLTPYFGANVVHRGDGLYGTTILTKFPVLTWSNAHLPNRSGMEQRGLLRVTMLVEGQQLTVYDTHLQHTSASMRLTQMKAIEPYVAKATGAVILGGDLNAKPDTPVMKVARTFLTDSWPQVGEGAGNTASDRHPDHRIDYVLHNDWLTPTAARVLPSKVSDHRSVVVDLDLYPDPRCPRAG